ncbi:hypothetical protein D3C87_1811430 [compost metagenome]
MPFSVIVEIAFAKTPEPATLSTLIVEVLPTGVVTVSAPPVVLSPSIQVFVVPPGPALINSCPLIVTLEFVDSMPAPPLVMVVLPVRVAVLLFNDTPMAGEAI